MRILVMDSDHLSCARLSSILVDNGYDVISTGNGREGVRIMRESGADAVVTSLFLPEQDGLATIAMLRKEFPDVLLVAAMEETQYLSLENARATATVLGADSFITKPFDSSGVLEALGEPAVAYGSAE